MQRDNPPAKRRVAIVFGLLLGSIALVNLASGSGDEVGTVCSKDQKSLKAQLTGGQYIVDDRAVFDGLQENTTYKISYDKSRWILHLRSANPLPPEAQQPKACQSLQPTGKPTS